MATVALMFSSNIVHRVSGPVTLLFFILAAPILRAAGNGGAAAAPLATHLSPQAVEVSPQDAWRLAEQCVAGRPDRDVVIGRGDSMLPLYRDRTVLVLERMEMSALRPGMTVVFLGDSGRPVAHTLVEKTWFRGWRAAGIASGMRDQTLIQSRNYIGTVIRAYAPNRSVPSLAETSRTAGDRLTASVAPGGQ